MYYFSAPRSATPTPIPVLSKIMSSGSVQRKLVDQFPPETDYVGGTDTQGITFCVPCKTWQTYRDHVGIVVVCVFIHVLVIRAAAPHFWLPINNF